MVSAVSGTNEVTLHSKEITVLEASYQANGTSAPNKAQQISYNLKYNTVNIVFENNIEAGGNGSIHIKFRGILNSDMAGFYK